MAISINDAVMEVFKRPKRLQDELNVANERLKHVAQNFSMEWKAILSYAIQNKQETKEPDPQLEDLLLQSQSGLLMLREMPQRREAKWKEVIPWSFSCSPHTSNDRPSYTPAPRHVAPRTDYHHAFVQQLRVFQEHKIAMCHLFLNRSLIKNPSNVQHPQVTKKLKETLVIHHRLIHNASPDNILSCVRRQDIECFLRFKYLHDQYGIVFDRFLIRLQSLVPSYRYHIRQRMLDLIDRHKVHHVVNSLQAWRRKAKDARSIRTGVECPLFILTPCQLETELSSLVQFTELSCDHREVVKFKVRVLEIFCGWITSTLIQQVSEHKACDALSLISTPILHSRWQLMQRNDTMTEGVNGQKGTIDVLLQAAYDLLCVNDTDYLLDRLKTHAKNHVERAMVEMNADKKVLSTEEKVTRNVTSPYQERLSMLGITDEMEMKSLEAFYVLRFLSCRTQRHQLMRWLNYQHFLWFSRRHQAEKRMNPESDRYIEPTENETKPGVVMEGVQEYVFPETIRDLHLLETRLLQVASHFIAQQQERFLMQQSNDEGEETSYLMVTDRMQVLCDLYECEVRFQQAKTHLLIEMLECGYALVHTETIESGEDALGRVLQQRPLIDLTHMYFEQSYSMETLHFTLRRTLYQEINRWRKNQCRLAHSDQVEEWLHHQLIKHPFLIEMEDLWSQVMQQADLVWFVPTLVSEWHALQQAIIERIVVVWKLIVTVEVPSLSFATLECTDKNILQGNGWRLVFPPELLDHVISNVMDQIPATQERESARIETLVEMLYVLEQRRALGKQVYETQVMEKIYTYQLNFASFLQQGRVENPSLLFCDAPNTRTTNDLVPIVHQLIPNCSDEFIPTQFGTVVDWLTTALLQNRLDTNRLETKQTMWFQTLYTWYLKDLVQYHDMLASEIIEFAAAAPLLFHDNSISQDRMLNLKLIRSKYMEEIVEKVQEAIENTCSPHWQPLDHLKKGLISVSDDKDMTRPELYDALVKRMKQGATQPQLLGTLHTYLNHLRNEINLAQHVFSDEEDMTCVFHRLGEERNGLTMWLITKLNQYKQDLKLDKTSEEPEIKRPCRGDEEKRILLTIPSVAELVYHFNVSCTESGKEITLMTLVEVYELLTKSLVLIRQECCLGFFLHGQTISTGMYRFRRWLSTYHQKILMFHERMMTELDPMLRMHSNILTMKQPDQLVSALRPLYQECHVRQHCLVTAIALQSFALSWKTDHSPRNHQLDLITMLLSVPRPEWMLVELEIVANSSELIEFWKLVTTTQDSRHLEALKRWIELLFAFICDVSYRRHKERSIHAFFKQVNDKDVSDALIRLEGLVRQYRVFYQLNETSTNEDDEDLGNVVSGTHLRMRTPALFALVASPSHEDLSPLGRMLRAITGTTEGGRPSRILSLPTMTRLWLQIEIISVHLEIQWIEEDIQHMQVHYESFVGQRLKYQQHRPVLINQEEKESKENRVATILPVRFRELASFYHSAEGEDEGHFHIPTTSLLMILRESTQKTEQLHQELLQTHTLAMEYVQMSHDKMRKELAMLNEKTKIQHVEESLKRQAFAVEETYQLRFHLDKQEQEKKRLEQRMEMEKQVLTAKFESEFETKWNELHAQLLLKQQHFEEYRHVMQQDLKQQLQIAQRHVIHQVVDESGSITLENKAHLLMSLQGNANQVQLEKENMVLKQTILKLQTLYDIQKQSRLAHEEKERTAHSTHRMREQQLLYENAQLQHQLKELEIERNKISQERTWYQIQWNSVQTKLEEKQQQRQQAKLRALSAPIQEKELSVPDYEQEQETFEQKHEIAIRQPVVEPQKSTNEDIERIKQQCQNTTRHYQQEIKRLQQQLARERKWNSAMLDQVTNSRDNNDTPTQVVNSSPRAASASIHTPRQSRHESILAKRPNTLFSPRAPHVRPTTAAASPSPTPFQLNNDNDESVNVSSPVILTPSTPTRSRKATSATPTRPPRKFEVFDRDVAKSISGIAGTPNTLSVREPLPYR